MIGIDALPAWLRSKVEPDPATDCWLWTASTISSGYGCVWLPVGRRVVAHRYVYGLLIRPLTDEEQGHHLCHTRLCVNPAHIQPMTRAEHGRLHSTADRTHCARGHLLDEKNTRASVRPNGWNIRYCRACDRIRKRRYLERKRAQYHAAKAAA